MNTYLMWLADARRKTMTVQASDVKGAIAQAGSRRVVRVYKAVAMLDDRNLVDTRTGETIK